MVNKIVDPGRGPHEVRVYEMMSKTLVRLSPGLALKYCARLMHSTGIGGPVMFDATHVVGILSNTDIFDAIKV